jgi:hypothetical protein
MLSRTFTLLLILVFTSLISCTKDDQAGAALPSVVQIEYESIATIGGEDPALCACCGCFMITIEGGEPWVNDRFCELPPDSDIDLTNVEFPVSVELNWSPTGDCGRYILIESIALIE